MKKIIITALLSAVCVVINVSTALSDMGGVDIHGFISQGYLKSTDNDYMADTEDGTFQYNEMGINFTILLSPQLRMGAQFFARDLGDFGNDEIELDWAYAEYRVNNPFGIRAGKFKITHGLYNEVRDIDSVRSSVLLPRSLYLEGMREIFVAMKGINIFGQLPFGISYVASYGMQNISLDMDITNVIYSFFTNGLKAYDPNVSGVINSIDSESCLNFGLIWETPLEGLKASFTVYKPEFKEEVLYNLDLGVLGKLEALAFLTFEPAVYTCSLEYIFYNTVIALEGILIKADYELAVTGLPEEKGDIDIGGGYVCVSQRLTDYLELGAYYSVFYEDLDDKEGDSYTQIGEKDHIAWEKDTCVSARFDINESWIVKLEAHLINGTNMIDNRVRTGDLTEEYMVFAVKASYSF